MSHVATVRKSTMLLALAAPFAVMAPPACAVLATLGEVSPNPVTAVFVR